MARGFNKHLFLVFVMSLIPIYLGWLFLLIYGVVLLRAAKYRKTGIMLIILFFVPIAFIAFMVWSMESRLEECLLLGIEDCGWL